tara:strand:+ start:603 stop:899 length:297 start_codon:yes stop_codon:yes gene_type:complete
VGFTSSLSLPRDWWSLTPPFQPCLKLCQNKSISGLLSAALSISIRLLPLGGTLFCGARTFLSDIQSNHSISSDYQKTDEIKRVIQKIQVRNFNIYFFK